MIRVEDVCVHADDHGGHRDGMQRFVQPAAAAADVVAVKRFGEGDVAGGVKTLGELFALVLEVALHGESLVVGAERPERILAGLGGGAETFIDFQLAAIRQVRDPARRRKTCLGGAAGAVVVAAAPVRVAGDRADLCGLDTDLSGARTGGHREHQREPNPVRVQQRPLQSACATHRAAEHRVHPGDANRFECRRLCLNLVAD